MPRHKKDAAADAAPKYVFKRVRATQTMWDGIQVREPGDEFPMRIFTHFPEHVEEWKEDGTLKRDKGVKRNAKGEVEYYAVDTSDEPYEIIGEVTAREREDLEAVIADPTILLPDHQRPIEDQTRSFASRAQQRKTIEGVTEAVASATDVL